ncbi:MULTISPECIES: phosphate acyltransferase PlsX [Pseudoalteromonas]|uniref:phosphate acyltransferase PlsX n=1 Tax=Pseudoalteromonas TaxID=53246 RepID=UPI00029A9D55|nr:MULTISPECIES: phosphate acyltransferase PlsX [Pseudoalteromonas]AUJ70281.1 Phosphate acyltransferase [Pseudoalteromonas sp. NC201]MBR8841344.1 phosphate acyltransferase PlsX [Pseudoalteromonas sp. JC3]MCF2827004.1 phosphate acyltransferase PlsX [Pseudoalteromonas sp. OF5H-5]MCF2832452.1 phosphate acyltransferase PlsX [Pseudoalteromonas sp. DL2-H6]MCF2923868.1 phosphate acyltransferase PlsX [Pseudoalteromonas sp. DL2-H1]
MLTDLTIALDMMGGDYGPRSSIPAAIAAVLKHPNLNLILCGNQQVIESALTKANMLDHPRLKIKHCKEVVTNGCEPASALRNKKQSSMRIALDLVKSGEAQACVSSGNTGALFFMAHYVLKMLPGIKRPALISAVPTEKKQPVYLLDLGANVHCDPETLYQFGIMGSIVAGEALNIPSPKVCLLNIGSEEIKGHDGIKQAAKLMKSSSVINYQGYCEGSDMFSGKADVIVCEGFVGNVALKTCEGIAKLIMHKFSKALKKHFFYKALAFLLRPVIKKLYRRVNPDQYNGASLVGLRGIVVKSHGNATTKAFLAAIEEAAQEVQRKIPEKIQTVFAQVDTEKQPSGPHP